MTGRSHSQWGRPHPQDILHRALCVLNRGGASAPARAAAREPTAPTAGLKRAGGRVLTTHQDPADPSCAPRPHGGKLRHRKAKECGGTHLRPASRSRSQGLGEYACAPGPGCAHPWNAPRRLRRTFPTFPPSARGCGHPAPHFQDWGSPRVSNSLTTTRRPDLTSCGVGFDTTPLHFRSPGSPSQGLWEGLSFLLRFCTY